MTNNQGDSFVLSQWNNNDKDEVNKSNQKETSLYDSINLESGELLTTNTLPVTSPILEEYEEDVGSER